MVDPRMVAARIQNFWRATQFGSNRTERIAASSHGLALGLIMARYVGWATRPCTDLEHVARLAGALPTRTQRRVGKIARCRDNHRRRAGQFCPPYFGAGLK